MSTAALKTPHWRQVMTVLVSSIGTAIFFSGCSANSFQSSDQKWETYHNSRYGFEFIYPSGWISSPSPDNQDGVTLIAPKNQNTKIRAWASQDLTKFHNSETKKQIDHNFATAQGISGVLVVDIGEQVSLIKLSITQGQLKYYWQGQTNSKEFKDYYKLFYYIAKQYKISRVRSLGSMGSVSRTIVIDQSRNFVKII